MFPVHAVFEQRLACLPEWLDVLGAPVSWTWKIYQKIQGAHVFSFQGFLGSLLGCLRDPEGSQGSLSRN